MKNKVLVAGCGISGIGAARMLLAAGKSVILYVPDNIFYYKGVFNGNYTANPKQGRTHGFQDVL